MAAKPNLSQTKSLLSFVQVLRTLCAKAFVEQKKCFNVGVPLLKLSTHIKSNTLYVGSHVVMWWTKFSQLNGLTKIITVLDRGKDILAN